MFDQKLVQDGEDGFNSVSDILGIVQYLIFDFSLTDFTHSKKLFSKSLKVLSINWTRSSSTFSLPVVEFSQNSCVAFFKAFYVFNLIRVNNKTLLTG